MEQEHRLNELEKTHSVQEEIIKKLTDMTSDHETRLRRVERILGYGAGAAGFIYFIVENYLSKVV